MATKSLGRTGESISELQLGTIYLDSTIDRETSYRQQNRHERSTAHRLN